MISYVHYLLHGYLAGWAVMPCCIKKEMYLGEACSVQLSSCAAHNEHDDRYSLLCGKKEAKK